MASTKDGSSNWVPPGKDICLEWDANGYCMCIYIIYCFCYNNNKMIMTIYIDQQTICKYMTVCVCILKYTNYRSHLPKKGSFGIHRRLCPIIETSGAPSRLELPSLVAKKKSGNWITFGIFIIPSGASVNLRIQEAPDNISFEKTQLGSMVTSAPMKFLKCTQIFVENKVVWGLRSRSIKTM